jgi:D-alanyl-D-alanine carboxypeptidase
MLALALVLALMLTTTVGAARAQEETVSGPEGDAGETSGTEEVAAGPAPPAVDARAWTLVDEESGKRLGGEDIEDPLPIASTTKIMVALVVLEGDVDLEEEVEVSSEAAAYATPEYSNVGLFPGDTLSVRELLTATMVASGDDAVYALAEHVGDGSVDAFVEKMNEKATSLGLEDTHFTNPIGLDAREHYSSAADLAEMTRAAFKSPLFAEMVGAPYATITTQDREIPLTNTNELLFAYALTTGVKTGTTPAAGSSLVASAASGDESYVAVLLDAREDRFAAAVRTLEHGFSTYEREELVPEGERYAERDLPYRRDEEVGLVAEESVEGLVWEDAEVRREVDVVEELPPSAKKGRRLGMVTVSVGGEVVGESPLLARTGYDRASVWERVWYTVGGVFVEEE